MPDRLLSIPEAATALDVSRPTVYRLIAAGKLPAVPIPISHAGERTALRVRAKDIDAYLAQRRAYLDKVTRRSA